MVVIHCCALLIEPACPVKMCLASRLDAVSCLLQSGDYNYCKSSKTNYSESLDSGLLHFVLRSICLFSQLGLKT